MTLSSLRRSALHEARRVARCRDVLDGVVRVPVDAMMRLQATLARLDELELQRRLQGEA